MKNKIYLFSLFVIFGFISFTVYTQAGSLEDYDWYYETCPCDEDQMWLGHFNGEDYSQEYEDQMEAWHYFCLWHGLDEENDFLGYRTFTYDCHSYVFHNGIDWLDSYAAEHYLILGIFNKSQRILEEVGECYYCDEPEFLKNYLRKAKLDEGGVRWIWYDPDHSCEWDYSGKCDTEFLCKNTDKVYDMQGAQACFGGAANNPRRSIR